MAFIDYKIKMWNRIHFSDAADIEKLKQILIKDQYPIDDLVDEESGFTELENLFETEEYITPDVNEKNATIELYDDNGKLIWSNELKN